MQLWTLNVPTLHLLQQLSTLAFFADTNAHTTQFPSHHNHLWYTTKLSALKLKEYMDNFFCFLSIVGIAIYRYI